MYSDAHYQVIFSDVLVRRVRPDQPTPEKHYLLSVKHISHKVDRSQPHVRGPTESYSHRLMEAMIFET